MENKQTAVEWLYEKMSYVTWMRNRDEISPGIADEWRKHYLDVAKEMEKQQIVYAFSSGWHDGQDAVINNIKHIDLGGDRLGEQFYKELTISIKSHKP